MCLFTIIARCIIIITTESPILVDAIATTILKKLMDMQAALKETVPPSPPKKLHAEVSASSAADVVDS